MKSKLKIIIPIGIAVIAIALAFVFIRFAPTKSSVDIGTMISTAQQYLTEQKYEQAVAEFQKIIDIDPKNVDAYIGLANAYIGLGDTDKAVEVLEDGYDKTGDERIKAMLDELLPNWDESAETTVITTTAMAETTTVTTVTEAPKSEYVYMYALNNAVFEKSYDYDYDYSYSPSYHHVELDYHGYTMNFDYDENGISKYGVFYYKNYYELVHLSNNSKELMDGSISVWADNTEDSVVKFYISREKAKKESGRVKGGIYSGGSEIEIETEYKYDENDTIIEMIDYYAGTNDIYGYSKYDSYGNQIKRVEPDHESTNSYVYNPDGSVAESTHNSIWKFDDDTSYSAYVYKYTYDSNGNCTRIVENYTRKDSDGDSSESENITDFFYNDDNNIVKEEHMTDGKKVYTTVYEYDSYGNLISQTETTSYGTESEKYSYTRVKILRSDVEMIKNEFGIELNVFEID